MTDVSALPDDVRVVEMIVRAPEELAADTHGFMGGWWAVRVAGDIVTQAAVRLDGHLSLLRRYEEIDFLAVIRSGEFLRFRGEIVRIGNTSRELLITGDRLTRMVEGFASDPVEPPERVFAARAIIVVPKDEQRRPIPGRDA
jgi:3-aminobutyryl-CoA ammonia-lyase